VWTLFRFELRHLLRDLHQLVLVAVIVPLVLAPFVARSFERAKEQGQPGRRGIYFFAFVGKAPDDLRQLLLRSGRFRELPLAGDPLQALRNEQIELYLTIGEKEGREDSVTSGATLTPRALRGALPGTPRFTIHFTSGRERSWRARDAMRDEIIEHVAGLRERYVEQHTHLVCRDVLQLESVNLATEQQEKLQIVAALLPILMVFIFFGTGSITALDAIAGERERGSLATVLVSALTRRDIAVGKWLSVLVVSLAFGILQALGVFWRVESLGGSALSALPLGFRLLLLLLGVAMAALVAALLLAISAHSTSFKQAQLLYMPSLLVVATLSAVSWLESMPLASVVVALPVAGLSLAIRDCVLLEGSPFWLLLGGLFSLFWTGFFLLLVERRLELEDDRPVSDVPQEQWRLQLGQDIIWFYACMAALMVILPGNFPVLAGLRGQVLVNQGLMLLVPLLLLRFYRQPAHRALRLGNTSAMNWAIIVLLAPLVHICANSVAILSSWMVPISEEMVRQMTETLLPETASAGELLVLIAASPALCEEIAFRGVLLHSWATPRDSQAPGLRTCFMVGLLFGCFHFSLQRLLPTAIIGTVLTFVALRTGSILPCILLHFCNNALALLLHAAHLDYTAFPAWTWLASWGLLLYLLRGLQGKGFPPADREFATHQLSGESKGST